MKNDIATRLICIQGDITTLDVDMIANAANKELVPGGGVDGAINRAAGSELGNMMRAMKGCPVGQAKITEGYNLKARWIAHAVGPVYNQYPREEAEILLRSAYSRIFDAAVIMNLQTVAAPLLSTGVYGYPMAEACRIAVETAYEFVGLFGGLTITLVAFDEATFHILVTEGKLVYHRLQSKKSDDLPKVVSPHS